MIYALSWQTKKETTQNETIFFDMIILYPSLFLVEIVVHALHLFDQSILKLHIPQYIHIIYHSICYILIFIVIIVYPNENI